MSTRRSCHRARRGVLAVCLGVALAGAAASARANPAGRINIRYSNGQPAAVGTLALAVDPSGNLFTRGYEFGAAGAAAFNNFSGLLVKFNGTPLYGLRADDPTDATKMGQLVIANSFTDELVSQMPLPTDPAGAALVFKSNGVGRMEFDSADHGGAIFISQFFARGFGYRKSAVDYGYSSMELQNFLDAMAYLQATPYYGSACGATTTGEDEGGTSITYHLPGGVTHFSKYDEVHGTNMTHNQPDLLPWHRHLLRYLEDELRAYDPTVSIPYWDWGVGSAYLMYPYMPNFMGTPNNLTYDANGNLVVDANGTPIYGAANRGVPIGAPWTTFYQQSCDTTCSAASPPRDPCTTWAACVPSGHLPCRDNTITAAWNTAFPIQTITRVAQLAGATFSPGRGDSELMGYVDFKDFADNLNLDHDEIHQTYFGDTADPNNSDSTIGPPETAARDPFFFLLHANIDRIWASWQIKNGRADPGNPSGDYGSYINTPVPPNMEGIQTIQEPWADIMAGQNMPGYRHVRPYTNACGTQDNCTAGDPYTPQPHLKSTDPSIVVPPIYDFYVQ